MYEQGVRARVIERIMGWAPRQMYERHYLRVADQPMHDAIRGLYRDDPICDRQQQRSTALPSRPRPRSRHGWPPRQPGSNGSNSNSASAQAEIR